MKFADIGIVILLLFLLFLVWIDSETEPVVSQNLSANLTQNTKGFTSPFTYDYSYGCTQFWRGNYPKEINKSLEYIENKTEGAVTFQRVNDSSADIYYFCIINNGDYNEATYIGPGVISYIASEMIPKVDHDGNTIRAKIYIYKTPCLNKEKPTEILFPTLLALGLKTTPDYYKYKNDIMYPSENGCYGEISDKDILYLKNKYGTQE
jgi:hypothetical protein